MIKTPRGASSQPKTVQQKAPIQQTKAQLAPGDKQAKATLEFFSQPLAGDTITIGTKVYRYMPAVARNGDLVIGATLAESAGNLTRAINHSEPQGGHYQDGSANKQVTATNGSGNRVHVTSRTGGTASNSIRVDSSQYSRAKWKTKTLVGGVTGNPDPVEDPDNLRSRSFARVVDALCEGEIEGLVTKSGAILRTHSEFGKGIFIDDSPLINSAGRSNFAGVKVGFTPGTQDQVVFNGFGPASEVIYSGVQIKHGAPVTIGIANPDADRAEIAIRFSALLTQDTKTGNITGSAVTFRVQVALNGGAYVTRATQTVRGKASGAYIKSVSVPLTHSATPETDSWTVRVIRDTADAPNRNTQNDCFLDFATVYTRQKFRYPNTALVAVEINAEGFQGIPSRSYLVRGLRVRVPSNYFPETRQYNRDHITGDPVVDGGGDPVPQIWNGSFYTAWTDNPAWCFFELVTNRRFGLGEFVGVTDATPDGAIDKWTLYTVSQYCDELVDDGTGIMEPRFTCNLAIQSREDAWKVLQDMASIFRGILYWAQGAIVTVQDRPREVIATFTAANVKEGTFVYSGTSRKARHNVAIVRWNDPADRYRPKYEYVEDTDGILRYGYRQTEIAAFGTTSRGQAHRLGRHVLTTELQLTETITFVAGMDGAYLKPGDVIGVIDNARAGVQQGGRIVAISADRKTVTLDREVTITVDTTIHLTRPAEFTELSDVADSTQIAGLRTSQIYTAAATNAAGTTIAITVEDAIPAEVFTGCVFLLSTTAVEVAQYSVVSVSETGPREYEIAALEYRGGKFAAIEQGIQLEEPDLTDLTDNAGEVMEPRNLTLATSATITETGVDLAIVATWEASAGPSGMTYLVESRHGTDNFEIVTETPTLSARIPYTVAGLYEIKITAIGDSGQRSGGLIESITIADTNPIEAVRIAGLELIGAGNDQTFIGTDAAFEWRLISPATGADGEDLQGLQDPYFDTFEITIKNPAGETVFRHTTKTPSFVFDYEKNRTSIGGPHREFSIEVRALDKFRNASPAATLAVINPAPAPPEQASGIAAWRNFYLEWVNPDAIDLAAVEIWEGAPGDASFAAATLIATVTGQPGERASFSKTGLPVGVSVRFWLRSVDTFGSHSAETPTAGIPVTAGVIETQDIAEFAIDATRLFIGAIVLTGDRWLDNQPAAGRIAWNAHTLVFRGVKYEITAGDTPATHEFVWWKGPVFDADGSTLTAGESSYRTAATHPKDAGVMSENDFVIATNAEAEGLHDLAWRGIANAVIGSAMIVRASIGDAHINSVSADKIRAGIIDAQIVKIGGVTGALQSTNYAQGVSGWRVLGDGTAEFNAVTVRGTLDAATIYNNSRIANKLYPNNTIKSVAFNTTGNADWNYQWGVGGTGGVTRILYGGAWNGTAYAEAGIAANKNLRLGPQCRLYGTGVADGGLVYSGNRLGTTERTAFLILFGGNRSGTTTGTISILYRVYPAGISEPANDSTDYPWIQGAGSLLTNANLYFSGFLTLAIPADHIVAFAPAPINESGNSTSTTDHILNLSMQVLAFNP